MLQFAELLTFSPPFDHRLCPLAPERWIGMVDWWPMRREEKKGQFPLHPYPHCLVKLERGSETPGHWAGYPILPRYQVLQHLGRVTGSLREGSEKDIFCTVLMQLAEGLKWQPTSNRGLVSGANFLPKMLFPSGVFALKCSMVHSSLSLRLCAPNSPHSFVWC